MVDFRAMLEKCGCIVYYYPTLPEDFVRETLPEVCICCSWGSNIKIEPFLLLVLRQQRHHVWQEPTSLPSWYYKWEKKILDIFGHNRESEAFGTSGPNRVGFALRQNLLQTIRTQSFRRPFRCLDKQFQWALLWYLFPYQIRFNVCSGLWRLAARDVEGSLMQLPGQLWWGDLHTGKAQLSKQTISFW